MPPIDNPPRPARMMASLRYPASARVRTDRVRELRTQAGLELSDVARLSCLSVSQVQELEGASGNGFYNHAIRLNAAARVARVLQVPDTELIEMPEGGDTDADGVLPDPVELILPKAGRQVDGRLHPHTARPGRRPSRLSGRVLLLLLLAAGTAAAAVYLR